VPVLVEPLIRVVEAAAWQGVPAGAIFEAANGAVVFGDASKPMCVIPRGWHARAHHAPVALRSVTVPLGQCVLCKRGAGSLAASAWAFSCTCGCGLEVCAGCVVGRRVPDRISCGAGFALGLLCRALFARGGCTMGPDAAVEAFVRARGCPRLCAGHTAVGGSAARQCWSALVTVDGGSASLAHCSVVRAWPAALLESTRVHKLAMMLDVCVLICAFDHAASAARMQPAAIMKFRQEARACIGPIAEGVGALYDSVKDDSLLRACTGAIAVLLRWSLAGDRAAAASAGGAGGQPSPSGAGSLLAARLKEKAASQPPAAPSATVPPPPDDAAALAAILRGLSTAGAAGVAAAVSDLAAEWMTTQEGAARAFVPERVSVESIASGEGFDLLDCVRKRWGPMESALCLPLACAIGRTLESSAPVAAARFISSVLDVARRADMLSSVRRVVRYLWGRCVFSLTEVFAGCGSPVHARASDYVLRGCVGAAI
jgi:hypothetical protein